MTATIQHFTRALLTPDLSLATLSDARAVTDRNGMPRMVRTTRFAEAEIEWRGERWLAAMPLTPAALPRIERTASVLRRMNTEHLTQFRILPEEMRWTDALGNERRTGLVLQQLPGREFAEALSRRTKRFCSRRSTRCAKPCGSWNSRTTISGKATSAGTGDESYRSVITTPA